MCSLMCECFLSSAAPILSSPSTLIDLSEFRLAYVTTCLPNLRINHPACLCLCDIRGRLKAKNLMYIKQILFVIEGLIRVLGGECM